MDNFWQGFEKQAAVKPGVISRTINKLMKDEPSIKNPMQIQKIRDNLAESLKKWRRGGDPKWNLGHNLRAQIFSKRDQFKPRSKYPFVSLSKDDGRTIFLMPLDKKRRYMKKTHPTDIDPRHFYNKPPDLLKKK